MPATLTPSALLFAVALAWVVLPELTALGDVASMTGEEVAVDWQPKVQIVGDSEWELDWLAGRVAWRSRVVRLNFLKVPHASMLRNPEDGIGFRLWARPKDSLAIADNAQAIRDFEQKILGSQGFVRGDFGYSRNRGHQLMETDEMGSEIEQRAIVPDWFVAIVLLALPAFWVLRRLLSVKRRAAGLCVACGYDLRGTPGRCPECGLVPTVKGAA